jgi:AAA15 family ATPase/GTPase
MLIEFSVENFLSFKELSTLSMICARPFKEHLDTNTISIDKKISLLKSVIIYGDNSSGKSNFLKAMSFMKTTVINSFRDALLDNIDKKFPLAKFALNSKAEKESSYFEISFLQNEIKYRYGFEIDYNKITAEWLYHTTSKEVYLFKRDKQNIEINKYAFKEGIGKEDSVKDNVLFLTLIAQLNGKISNEIITWFKQFNYINGIHDISHKHYTIEKLKSDKAFYNWILHFIKYLEITSLSTSEEEVSDLDLKTLKAKQRDEEVINFITSIQRLQEKQPKRDRLITYHRKYDENNVLIDTVPFNFDNQESEGTKKLFYLLGPWFDTLRNGKILVVDELDSRLHSNLTLRLIDFFHKYNKKNAQLIFAVHDISLLNKETFRRDQICFIEKDQFGGSQLFSLADFKTEKVRNKSAFDKNYIQGKYGAIPYFEVDDKLNDLLYG